jgi:hypothetical protein
MESKNFASILGTTPNIIFLLFVFLLTACGTTKQKRIQPAKNHFEVFFGLKLPVLSDNKKVFQYTKRVDQARKLLTVNGKDSIYRDRFEDVYQKNKEEFISYTYDFTANNIVNITEYYYQKLPQIHSSIKGGILHIHANLNFYKDTGRIRKYRSSISSEKVFEYGFDYGIWYVFDEKGKIVYSIDFEKRYQMKLADVIDLFIANTPSFEQGKALDVSRVFDKDSSYWVIYYEKEGRGYNFVIDDAAKKIISPDQKEKYLNKYEIITTYSKNFDKKYLQNLLTQYESY